MDDGHASAEAAAERRGRLGVVHDGLGIVDPAAPGGIGPPRLVDAAPGNAASSGA